MVIKKVFKYLGMALLILAVIVVGIVAYINTSFPKVDPPTELKVESTPELVARGEYLAINVSSCMDCHSTRDFSYFSGPLKPGTLGIGGERFDQSVGIPGVFHSKNITPFGIDRYTDGELYRVITTGVTKEEEALFPIMPYPYYAQMDPEDVYAIIAYLRTLPAVESQVPKAEPDFPFNLILKTIPQNAIAQKRPEIVDVLGYGKYMTTIAGCVECHTPVKKGRIIKEVSFGGGREFPMPNGLLRSANISSDATGIGSWTEEMFVARFKQYEGNWRKVEPGEMNSIMPWTMYAGMDTTDLRAIFTYLKQVKPIENTVVTFEAND